jgi:hypothetical protein
MTFEPRDSAAAESYPTFWDDVPAPAAPAAPDGDAYTTFVNLTEDELPANGPAGAD